MFQFFHLLPELDGEANICSRRACPGPARGPGAPPELIDRLGLRAVAALAPHQLSGGEQQRFALARALVGAPRLVLADEPIGNLDATSGGVVLDLLRAVADEGRGVLMVTHQAEATARADRVLRLADGVLVATGAGAPQLLDHVDAGP